jgi:hypothetical protein
VQRGQRIEHHQGVDHDCVDHGLAEQRRPQVVVVRQDKPVRGSEVECDQERGGGGDEECKKRLPVLDAEEQQYRPCEREIDFQAARGPEHPHHEGVAGDDQNEQHHRRRVLAEAMQQRGQQRRDRHGGVVEVDNQKAVEVMIGIDDQVRNRVPGGRKRRHVGNALAPRYPRVLSDDPDRRHPFQPSGQSDAWLAFADQIAQSRHAAQLEDSSGKGPPARAADEDAGFPWNM